jgi:hypothetical protein
MAETLLKTGSTVLTDTYAQKTAQRLGVLPEAIRIEFQKARRAGTTSVRRNSEPIIEATEPAPARVMPSEREFWLLRFVLSSDDYIDWLQQRLDLNWLRHPSVRQVVEARLKAHQDHTWRGVPSLLGTITDDYTQSLITEAVAEQPTAETLDRKLRETVLLLRNDHIDHQLAGLTVRIGQPKITENELVEIEQQKAHLRQLRRQTLE